MEAEFSIEPDAWSALWMTSDAHVGKQQSRMAPLPRAVAAMLMCAHFDAARSARDRWVLLRQHLPALQADDHDLNSILIAYQVCVIEALSLAIVPQERTGLDHEERLRLWSDAAGFTVAGHGVALGGNSGADKRRLAEYVVLYQQVVADYCEPLRDGALLNVYPNTGIVLLLFARALKQVPDFDLRVLEPPAGPREILAALPAACGDFLKRIGWTDTGWLSAWSDQLGSQASQSVLFNTYAADPDAQSAALRFAGDWVASASKNNIGGYASFGLPLDGGASPSDA